jgi:hypothetical protein
MSIQLGESRAPVGDRTLLDQRLEKTLKLSGSGGKILCPVIKLKPTPVAGRHAATIPARLFEHRNLAAVAQFAGSNKAGQSGADDCHAPHCAMTTSRDATAIIVAVVRTRKYVAEITSLIVRRRSINKSVRNATI